MTPPTQDNPIPESASSDPPDTEVVAVTRVRPLTALFLWAVLLVLAFLHFQATVFVVLGALAAAAFAATLQPLADRLWGPVPVRAVTAVLVFLIVVAVLLFVFGWAMYGPIQENIQDLPDLRRRANDGLQNLADRANITTEVTVSRLAEIAGQVLTGSSLAGWISKAADQVLTAMLAILVVVIAAMYLLARPSGSLSGAAVKLLPPERQEPTRRAVAQLQPQLRWWALGTAFSMSVVAVVFGLGFWILGLEFALPLALFAGLAQSVPTFGPLVTLLLALLVAATQGLTQVVGVIGLYVLVQSLESYILTPLVMRKAVRIPPVVTLFTIILWGNVFGLAGLILAIPIDLTLWAFLQHHLIEKHEQMAQPTVSEPP
jgi:predicted PurR-regulated permease PerM